MPAIQTQLKARDGGVTFTIDIQLWKDKDGRGFAAADPKDEASRHFMIHERGQIKAVLGQAHGLRDLQMYEHQDNGLYTPSQEDGRMLNGASLTKQQVEDFGERLQTQALKHSQDLGQHKMPAPTPHTSWPIDR